jgi:hypothetical protein
MKDKLANSMPEGFGCTAAESRCPNRKKAATNP